MRKNHLPKWMLESIHIGARLGFMTSSIWQECICHDVGQSRRYERLAILKALGLFENSKVEHCFQRVTVFSEFAKRLARKLGHKVFEEPSKTTLEKREDAFLIGFRLQKQGIVKRFFLRNEINRSLELLEFFNAKEFRNVLPELIVEFNGPASPFYMAIEIEIQCDKPIGALHFAQKYKTLSNINFVLGFTNLDFQRETIKWALKCKEYPNELRPVVFGNRYEFLRTGDLCPLELNDKVTTFREIFLGLLGKKELGKGVLDIAKTEKTPSIAPF